MTIELTVIFVVSFVAFAALAKLVHRFMWNVGIKERLGHEENAAHGIQLAGYFLGVLFIASAVLSGYNTVGQATPFFPFIETAPTPGTYAIQVAIYGVAGIVALGLYGRLGLRILLNVNILKAMQANNVAAGIVAAGSDISTALVIAGVFSGQSSGGDFAVALFFLIVGLATLCGLTYLYRFITSYNDSQEIMNDNVAAALSYAGMMVAIGMIVGHALEGDFAGYGEAFFRYGKALLAVLLLYPVRQFIVQGIFLGGGLRLYGGRLDEEISAERNVGAGAIELAAYIASAFIAFHLGY